MPQGIVVQMPRSFLVAVKTKKDNEQWAYNGLRFATPGEAEQWLAHLKIRWREVIHHVIESSDDAPNCTYPVPNDRYSVRR